MAFKDYIAPVGVGGSLGSLAGLGINHFVLNNNSLKSRIIAAALGFAGGGLLGAGYYNIGDSKDSSEPENTKKQTAGAQPSEPTNSDREKLTINIPVGTGAPSLEGAPQVPVDVPLPRTREVLGFVAGSEAGAGMDRLKDWIVRKSTRAGEAPDRINISAKDAGEQPVTLSFNSDRKLYNASTRVGGGRGRKAESVSINFDQLSPRQQKEFFDAVKKVDGVKFDTVQTAAAKKVAGRHGLGRLLKHQNWRQLGGGLRLVPRTVGGIGGSIMASLLTEWLMDSLSDKKK